MQTYRNQAERPINSGIPIFHKSFSRMDNSKQLKSQKFTIVKITEYEIKF